MTYRIVMLLLAGSLLVATCGLAATEPALGPNLVANGGFEAAAGAMDGWTWDTANAQKATMTVDPAVVHGGQRSIRCHSELALSPNVYAGLRQSVGGLTPGAEYIISLWAKGQGVGVCWFGGGPEWASRASFPTGTFGWTRLELRWRAPETPTNYDLRVNIDSVTEALWVDDISFREVDPLGAKPRVSLVTPAAAARLGYLLLTPTERAPRIDGDLTDWPATVITTRLPQDAGAVALDRHGDDDLSATLRTMADGQCLYLGVTVTDDVHWAPPEALAWTSDGLQVAFDPRHERTEGGYGPHDSEYSLVLDNAGQPRVQCWQMPQGLGDQSQAFALAAKRTGKTTVYEVAIPWKAIGVTVGVGGPVLGFDLLVNDNDGSGRRGYMELTQGIGKSKDASLYATALSSAARSVAVLPGKPVIYTGDSADLRAVVVLGTPLTADATLELAALDAQGRAVPLTSTPLRRGTSGIVQAECRLPAGAVPASTSRVRARVVQGATALATGTAAFGVSDLKQRLVKDAARLRQRTADVAQLAQTAAAKGIATDYERVTIAVARDFVDYALDDLAQDRPTRAAHVLAVLDDSLTTTAKALRSYLAGQSKPLLVPRFVTSPVSIQDGAFWADTLVPSTGQRERRPVFFVGYGHFGTIVRDLPKLPDLGANIIQIECGPNSTQPAEGVVTGQTVRDGVGRALAEAEKRNVMVVWLASPHYFPDWALKKWPDLTRGGGGFFGVAVDAPQARNIFRTHLQTALGAIGASPALHSVCLSNEPTFTNWQADPYRRAEFTDYLVARFGTVDRLNAAWGTSYASFAAVPILATDGLPGEDKMTPLRYEMARFNLTAFAEYHRFMSDVVHAARPGTWTHAKVMSVPADRQNLAWGCDPEQFAQMGDLNGNDCANMFNGFGQQYAANWLTQNVYYDLQRSMREVPVTNTEDHIIMDREQRLIPPQHTDFALWQGAIHGRGASTIWVWERTTDRTSDFEGSILHRPENVMAVGRVGLDLQRLAPEVVRLQRAEAPVAVLYSMTAQLWSDTASGAMLKAYEALNACGVPVRFVSEKQAAEGHLKDFRAVIAPAVKHAPDALVAAVSAYCQTGGKLWIVGDEPPFTRDEYNRPRALSLPDTALRWFPGTLGARDLARRFRQAMGAEGIVAPVTVTGPDGQALWAVECRAVTEPGGALVSIVNLWGMPQTVRLAVGGRRVERIDDLRRAKTINSGELTLQPLEAMLLRVR